MIINLFFSYKRMSVHSLFMLTLLILFNPATAQIIEVGKNVLVSADKPDKSYFEPTLAAHPTNPNVLFGGVMNIDDNSTVVYYSGDGGKNWTNTLHTNDYEFSSDEACAYDADGIAYYAHMTFSKQNEYPEYKLAVHRSPDGGNSWEKPTLIPITYHGLDRPYIVVDKSGDSPYKGNVYIHNLGRSHAIDGTRYRDLSLYTSSDKGKTFFGPLKRFLTDPDDEIGGTLSNGVVLSDGTWVAVFGVGKRFHKDLTLEETKVTYREEDSRESHTELYAIKSSDGGFSLDKPTKVTDMYKDRLWTMSKYQYNFNPSLAVDRSKSRFNDRLYLTWMDIRSGRAEIYLTYSSDKGETWSSPVRVNDDQWNRNTDPIKDHFLPAVSVNNKGIVCVLWYDRRNHADNLGYHVRCAVSINGGKSFLPSVTVSETSSEFGENKIPDVIIDAIRGGNSFFPKDHTHLVYVLPTGHAVGHTSGFAADAKGIFHAFWIENRTGKQQLWTTGIKVDPEIELQNNDVSGSRDITNNFLIKFNNTQVDMKEGTISTDLQLQNITSLAIEGPIEVHVQTIKSDIAKISVPNISSNGEKRYWTVVPEKAILHPKAISMVKRVSFKVSDLKPYVQNHILAHVLDMEVKVFGTMIK
ncbi:MAG: glycoside hydrolase [Cytophagales bacterium]|nr:glycoside hydrolase [Cytophagales bacterium]